MAHSLTPEIMLSLSLSLCPLAERDALSAEVETLKAEKTALEAQVGQLKTELARVKQELEDVKKTETTIKEAELKQKEIDELALLRKTFGMFKKGIDEVFTAMVVDPPTPTVEQARPVVAATDPVVVGATNENGEPMTCNVDVGHIMQYS